MQMDKGLNTLPQLRHVLSSSQKKENPRLKLYAYGSRQSDQFYLPQGRSETRRPFCLSDLENFTIEAEQSVDQKFKLIPNPLFKSTIYKIACGGLHTVVLTTNGEVYTFGCNDEGALGRKGEQCIPIKVELEDPVDLISAGDNHSLFANSINGAVYFTGNYNFKRGQKMTDSLFQPIKFYISDIDYRTRDKPIQKLASGANHSIIMVDGKLFCRGEPEAYTTGRRINQRRKTKASLTFDGVGLTHVIDVWCGGYHSVAKKKKGNNIEYYAWGSNGKGQLGINSYQHQPFPVQIQKLRGRDVVCMAAGTDFSIFLTKDGEILSCGNNENGNLGLGQDFIYEEHLSDYSEDELKDRKKRQQREKEQQQQRELQQNIQQKLFISNGQKSGIIQDVQGQLRRQLFGTNELENSNFMIKEKSQEIERLSPDRQKRIQQRTYVRSLRRVIFKDPPLQPISNIQCGSNFTIAWNSHNLYSWGFAMNYVLLNGSEDDDEATPFKVKEKIINYETIYSVAAGSQHVVYTSYESLKVQNEDGQIAIKTQGTEKVQGPNTRVPKIVLSSKVRDRKSLSKKKLGRKNNSKGKK